MRPATGRLSRHRPVDVPGFVAAELLGAVCALALMSWLLKAQAKTPHPLPPVIPGSFEILVIAQ